jgi:Histidine kinase
LAAERRRIERDRHDGAQQYPVALPVNPRLARELAESDAVGVRAVLDELAGDVHVALEEIRHVRTGSTRNCSSIPASPKPSAAPCRAVRHYLHTHRHGDRGDHGHTRESYTQAVP